MAKVIAAENAEVWSVPAVASSGAMTVTEGDAGTRLTGFIQGGVSLDFSSNQVDSATLVSAFNSTTAGTYGGGTNTLSGVLWDSATNTAYNGLPRGTAFYLVISLASAANQSGAAWATGDIYNLYEVEVTSRGEPDLTRDALLSFDVDFAITAVPTYGGTAA